MEAMVVETPLRTYSTLEWLGEEPKTEGLSPKGPKSWRAVVAKRVVFDAAHYLPNYEGKCRQLHGHRWVVEVACSGEVKSGFVVDFVELKEFLQRVVVDKFDHKVVNDVLENPTAEVICKDIFDGFLLWCAVRGLGVTHVRVHETEDSYAEIRG